MVGFIDQQRAEYGVEPICAVLPIASSTYYEHKARQRDPSLPSERAKRDDESRAEIGRIWHENFEVYRAEKVWRHVRREQIPAARCTVERLMHGLGLQGAVRGRKVKTTIAEDAASRPLDLVKREVQRDWARSTLGGGSHLRRHLARVRLRRLRDRRFSRTIVGWRVSSSSRTDLALDALEQALHARPRGEGQIHHSDRGVQYLSIHYTERLAEAGIESSVRSVGDSYDNALAESIIGLHKTEVICARDPQQNTGRSALLLRKVLGPIRLEPTKGDIGRPFYRAHLTLDVLALLDAGSESSDSDTGSSCLRQWSRSQRIRTFAQVPFEAAILEAAPSPACQRIAREADWLVRLGLSRSRVAVELRVSTKAVAKTVAWFRRREC